MSFLKAFMQSKFWIKFVETQENDNFWAQKKHASKKNSALRAEIGFTPVARIGGRGSLDPPPSVLEGVPGPPPPPPMVPVQPCPHGPGWARCAMCWRDSQILGTGPASRNGVNISSAVWFALREPRCQFQSEAFAYFTLGNHHCSVSFLYTATFQ